MQRAVNVELSPEEDTTVSVSANDLRDCGKGGLCMVRMSWFAVCDGDEGIPFPP